MLSKLNSTSGENVRASEKAIKNREKLKEMDRSFVTALVSLVLAKDELNFLVAKLHFELERDPLHPLYEHLDRVQTILTYLCVEIPETRDKMRSELKEIAAEYILPRPNVHTSTSLLNPDNYTDTSVTSRKPASCESTVTEKRSSKRLRVRPYEKVVDFGNLTKEIQKGKASTIPNGHDGQATSFTPLATGEQQLPQFSHMQHTSPTSELNYAQEGDDANSLTRDIIGGQQPQPVPYPVFKDIFGNTYSS